MTIMRIPTVLILALATFLTSQVSYAAEVITSSSDPVSLDVVFVDLPVVYTDDKSEDGVCANIDPDDRYYDYGKLLIHRIFIDQNSDIFWNDGKVANENLDEILKQNLVADGRTELQFYPSENAPAGVAINTLKRTTSTKFPCFGFVGNEQYRKIWRSKTPDSQPWVLSSLDLSPSPEREKTVPPVAIQIISTDNEGRGFHDVGFAGVSSAGRCRAYINGKPVSSNELVDLVTKTMSDAFDRAGGEENFRKGTLNFEDLPDAIILTTPNTPWRCVGGGVFNLQLSGFISIGFALLPDSQ